MDILKPVLRYIGRIPFRLPWGATYFLLLISLPLLLPENGFAQTIQDVRVRWETFFTVPRAESDKRSAAEGVNIFTVLERRTGSGNLPRQRNPELSVDQILVIARDADGQLLDWQLVPDSRILRSEQPGPNGELSGQTVYRDSSELLITLPDDPKIKRIEFYQPRWTG